MKSLAIFSILIENNIINQTILEYSFIHLYPLYKFLNLNLLAPYKDINSLKI